MKTPHGSVVLILTCVSLLMIASLTSGCSSRQTQPGAPDRPEGLTATPPEPLEQPAVTPSDVPKVPEVTPSDAQEGPATAQTEDLEELRAALAAEVVDDRPGVLETLGRPDAFDISLVQVEGGEVRMESWRYYQFGTRVDFVDGEAVWTVEIEPAPDGTLFAAWYDPTEFEVGMPAAEAARVIAAASPAGAAPELIDLAEGGEDLAGGTALVGDQILIGLHEDRVVFVETVALVPEGGAQ